MTSKILVSLLLLGGACTDKGKEAPKTAPAPTPSAPAEKPPVAVEPPAATETEVADVIDLGESMKCAEVSKVGAWAFTTAEDFGKIGEKVYGTPECKDWKLPEIDFAKRVVFGSHAVGNCNIVSQQHKVFLSEGALVYEFSLKDEGDCERAALASDWVSVPKPAEGIELRPRLAK